MLPTATHFISHQMLYASLKLTYTMALRPLFMKSKTRPTSSDYNS